MSGWVDTLSEDDFLHLRAFQLAQYDSGWGWDCTLNKGLERLGRPEVDDPLGVLMELVHRGLMERRNPGHFSLTNKGGQLLSATACPCCGRTWGLLATLKHVWRLLRGDS